jgi:hypothetical protein
VLSYHLPFPSIFNGVYLMYILIFASALYSYFLLSSQYFCISILNLLSKIPSLQLIIPSQFTVWYNRPLCYIWGKFPDK